MTTPTGRASRERPAGLLLSGPTAAQSRAPGPAALLQRLGLRPRKSLSQVFLIDDGVCHAMADAAELSSADEVLEIGPGLGILTRALVERAGRVVAVELERQLAAHLPTLVPSERLEVVLGDALTLDPAAYFENRYKLVANLPYQITSPVLRRFLVEVRRPAVLVLMVQRELAARVVAPPGAATYLSTLARAVADVEVRRSVPPGSFYPRPKVTSAILRLRPRQGAVVTDDQLGELLRIVRAGFTQPRKTIANSLAQGLGVPRSEAERMLNNAGIEPVRRPQELAVEEWVALYRSGTSPG